MSFRSTSNTYFRGSSYKRPHDRQNTAESFFSISSITVIGKQIDNKKHTIMLLFYLSKAFHMVDHVLLPSILFVVNNKRLEEIGVRVKPGTGAAPTS